MHGGGGGGWTQGFMWTLLTYNFIYWYCCKPALICTQNITVKFAGNPVLWIFYETSSFLIEWSVRIICN